MNNKVPPIPEDLLLYLEEAYGPRAFNPGHSIEQIMFQSGKTALVQWLRTAYENQQRKNPLEDL